MTRTLRGLLAALPLLLLGSALILTPGPGAALASGSPSGSFVNFESGQVRPLALSPDGTRLFAVNTPGQPARDLRRRRRRPDARRLGAGRPRAGRGRGAQRRRGLGGQPPLRLDQHRRRRRRRRRASSRTLLTCDEPRDIVFAGPGRAARLRHDGAPRPELPARSRCSRPPGIGRAPSCRCSTRPASATDARAARRSPTSSCSATRRARWRAAPTATPSTPPCSSPATRPRRSARARSATAARLRRPAARWLPVPRRPAGAEHQRRGHPGPRGRPDRPVRPGERQVGGRARPRLERRGALRPARPRRLRDRRRGRACRSRPPASPTSARCSSTWSTNPVSGKVYVSNTEARNEVRFEGPGLAFGSDAPCRGTCTRRASPSSTAPTCCRAT